MAFRGNLKHMFNAVDVDNSGYLDIKELKNVVYNIMNDYT